MAFRLLGVLLACLIGLVPVAKAGGGGYGYGGYGGYYYPYYTSYSYYAQPTYYTPQYVYYPEYHGAKYWPAGYYYAANGYWYRQGYSGPYYGEAYATTYTAPTPAVAYSADWRSKLLDVAKSRDDLVAYQQAIDKLGLSGTNGVLQGSPGYPGVQAYGHGYATPVLGPYGAQAATTYGYSVKQIQEAYGSTDLNTLYQQSARLAQGAQGLGSQATTDFMALARQAGVDARGVAETFSRGLALAEIIRAAGQAATPPASTRTTTVIQGATAGQAPVPAPMDPPADAPGPAVAPRTTQQAQAFLQTVAVPQCGGCHSGSDPKGKFNILSIPQLDGEGRAVVLERVLTADPEQGMPRTKDGKHAPLTKEQRRLWLKFFTQ